MCWGSHAILPLETRANDLLLSSSNIYQHFFTYLSPTIYFRSKYFFCSSMDIWAVYISSLCFEFTKKGIGKRFLQKLVAVFAGFWQENNFTKTTNCSSRTLCMFQTNDEWLVHFILSLNLWPHLRKKVWRARLVLDPTFVPTVADSGNRIAGDTETL